MNDTTIPYQQTRILVTNGKYIYEYEASLQILKRWFIFTWWSTTHFHRSDRWGINYRIQAWQKMYEGIEVVNLTGVEWK